VNTYYISIADQDYPVRVTQDGELEIGGKPVMADVKRIDSRTFSVLTNGSSYTVVAQKHEDGYQLLLNGRQMMLRVESERTRLLKQFEHRSHTGTKNLEIKAPMPALVVKLEVAVGDTVTQGQGLLVLEAMKMENEIKSHSSGRVKEILVTQGTPVEKGQLLMLLE
jgi:biotin carboxyl carrier protein